MENKLELKHLAPYLPYKLKCLCLINKSRGRVIVNKVFELHEIATNKPWKYWTSDVVFMRQINGIGRGFKINEFKPILRPMSEFTEDYLSKWCPLESFEKIQMELINDNDGYLDFIEIVDYKTCTELLEGHFDIFNLIPQGLAIDINTLR